MERPPLVADCGETFGPAAEELVFSGFAHGIVLENPYRILNHALQWVAIAKP